MNPHIYRHPIFIKKPEGQIGKVKASSTNGAVQTGRQYVEECKYIDIICTVQISSPSG